MWPSSSGSKDYPNRKPPETGCKLSLADPEDGGNIFLRNVWLSPNYSYTVLELRRRYPSLWMVLFAIYYLLGLVSSPEE
jgi:hypothetical protein